MATDHVQAEIEQMHNVIEKFGSRSVMHNSNSSNRDWRRVPHVGNHSSSSCYSRN
jgi:hypothetical protein